MAQKTEQNVSQDIENVMVLSPEASVHFVENMERPKQPTQKLIDDMQKYVDSLTSKQSAKS